MAVPLFGSGVRNNTQLTRSLDRVLEEAHLTGELYLSGRNLKEFPKVASKYDLEDTVSVDLSKNRLTELPLEVCDFISIERIDCYHNVMRSVPDNVVQLQVLTHLNLSRNQLTCIPSSLCQLHMLQVLLLCYNKLMSLPEEISQLQKLMDLDVSCNEISYLPTQIGFLKSLRSLNLRRNLLVELPNEITILRLVSLDVSSNRIVHLPPRLRIMESLSRFLLNNNPLSCPSAYLCTRGKVHIFKFLDIQAQRDDHKKGSLGIASDYLDSPHRPTSSLDLEANGFLTNSQKKNSQSDLGYSISEGDQRWSQFSQDEFLIRPRTNRVDQTLSKSESEDDVLLAEECRKASSKILELQQEESRRNSSQHKANSTNPTTVCSTLSQRKDYLNYSNGPDVSTSSSPLTMVESNNKPLEFTQTYKEYKEALKLQRSVDTNNVYRRVQPDTGGIANQANNLNKEIPSYNQPTSGIPPSNHINYNEDYTSRQTDVFSDQRYDTQSAAENHHRLDDDKRKQKLMQKEAVLSYVKSRTSPLRSSVSSDVFSSPSPLPMPMSASTFLSNVAHHPPHVSQSVNNTMSHNSIQNFRTPQLSPVNPSYTLRRESERAREDKELIDLLRQAIETRLKVSLPDDLASALTDGVVLCHLANHVRPRSIASIHVPSPAVPKLTVAKCRRNIENFLEACRRIGVAEEHLCTCDDILLGLREPRNVMACVAHLVKDSNYVLGKKPSIVMSPDACLPPRNQDDVLVSYLCIAIFIGSLLLLFILPKAD